MEISINSDYITSCGNPFPALTKIAEKGFSHIQWIHHWDTDFVYMDSEIDEIEDQMKKMNLSLNELHATRGIEKEWYAAEEYRRKAGIELVKNRVDMTSRLGGDCIVLHPFRTEDTKINKVQLEKGLESLTELKSYCMSRNIKIALENMTVLYSFDILEYYYRHFSPDYLGFCWDTGHSNTVGEEAFKRAEIISEERLCALHLNDNDAKGKDQHLIPYDGCSDWERIIAAVRNSPYRKDKPLTLEVSMKYYEDDEDSFLDKARCTGEKLTEMFLR